MARTILLATLPLLLTALLAGPASASTPAPKLTISTISVPTVFSPGDTRDLFQVTVTNSGSRPTSAPIDVTDLLPPNLSARSLQFFLIQPGQPGLDEEVEELGLGGCGSTCEYTQPLAPDEELELQVAVAVGPSATSGEENVVNVSENGTQVASAVTTDTLGPPLAFGPDGFSSALTSLGGTPETQAGGHPYEMDTRITFNSEYRLDPTGNHRATSIEDAKDIVVDLPLGLVGSALDSPQCTSAQLASIAECPAPTAVGEVLTEPNGNTAAHTRIFNMVPEHGVAAEFGFTDNIHNVHVIDANVVPTRAGYILRATTSDIPQAVFTNITAKFYGNPAEKAGSREAPSAAFTTPAVCDGQPLVTTEHMDSWQHPGAVNADGSPNVEGPGWTSATSESPAVTGCELLQFAPTLTLAPTSSLPDSPTGLNVNLTIPQSEDPTKLATPPLKDVMVTLPEGLAVSPSSANGLEACSNAQIGYLGETPSNFTPGPGSCPPGSQIGTVKIKTPLIAEELEGKVFLGTPECNPCTAADAQSGRMVRLFIEIHSESRGIYIKSPGTVTLNAATGRLTTTFKGLPQQPFSDLAFKFKEGPRAPLSTPTSCGTYETGASLTPWSTPYTPTVSSPSTFSIAGCTGNPFAPAFTGGTVSNSAGQFSPLTVSFSRQDLEQNFDALEATLPPGVLAKLAGVPQCGEAELNAAKADTGGCPAGSQIGTATVAAGPGSQPFYTTGKIYLTGAYNGGPFGAVTVVPAVAGPFNLGNVVVRGSIRIDPTTAQGSVVTDPFPSMLDGIPLQLRSVSVSVDRPGGFTFNSTTCNPGQLTATIASTSSTLAPVSSRYQAANCSTMPFHPVLSASTAGITSKANGASLRVKITANGGPDQKAGTEEANIAKVELTIPNALPTRLTTIQKACSEAQFNSNPAACPAASNIATAIVHTPLLSSPLQGPVYFVSHGGAAFPDTEIVLQGEGVKLVLDGHTDIKKGVTYSRFQSVPDAPFSSFEFVAPEGPYSIFAANGNLCAQTKTVTITKRVTKRIKGRSKKVAVKVKQTVAAALEIPATITAQSGAVLTQHTKVAVTGCPRAKAAKAAAAKRKAAARKAAAARRAAAKATRRARR